MMLSQEYLSMLRIDTQEELADKVQGFVRRLGLTFVTMTVADQAGSTPQFRSIHNLPASCRALYEDLRNAQVHPATLHCKRSSLPLVWGRPTFAASSKLDLWELQDAHGLSCGISLALHLPLGRHFCITASRDQALPDDAAELSRMTADLQLFAVYAQDAAVRLLGTPAANDALPPMLTSREAECLRWTTEGKTAWELGRILGISEHTAVRHLNNASQKLGAVNKHQAALRALRLNLIN